MALADKHQSPPAITLVLALALAALCRGDAKDMDVTTARDVARAEILKSGRSVEYFDATVDLSHRIIAGEEGDENDVVRVADLVGDCLVSVIPPAEAAAGILGAQVRMVNDLTSGIRYLNRLNPEEHKLVRRRVSQSLATFLLQLRNERNEPVEITLAPRVPPPTFTAAADAEEVRTEIDKWRWKMVEMAKHNRSASLAIIRQQKIPETLILVEKQFRAFVLASYSRVDYSPEELKNILTKAEYSAEKCLLIEAEITGRSAGNR